VAAGIAELRPEPAVSQNISNRTSQASISAALAAARAETSAKLASGNLPPAGRAASVRFPGEDGGRSLAELAERDLDAALQLLADRAQYITGASGAAIAIRRDGRNDMLCRASAGMNAPELGALLSTEFGLSGESVRTRQALRCDDAERDKRVNHDVCREMGIASVVVMPVVNDDEVLGVFELFSGKANAFGARDVSAVQRLSEMVETAVRLAQSVEKLPERLKMGASAGAPVEELEVEEVEVEVQEDRGLVGPAVTDVLQDRVLQEPVLGETVAADRAPVEQAQSRSSGAKSTVQKEDSIAALEALRHPKTSAETLLVISPEPSAETFPESAPQTSAEATTAKKKLFWSAERNATAEAECAEEADQSHVPPVLRSLRKCEACGFPVSAGRMLCVECEEKKWRGQLKPPSRQGKISRAAAAVPTPGPKPGPKPEARAFAAAQSAVAGTPAAATRNASATVVGSVGDVTALPAVQDERGRESSGRTMASAPAAKEIDRETGIKAAAQTLDVPSSVRSSEVRPSEVQPSIPSSVPPSVQSPVRAEVRSSVGSPEFVLSAGLEPSQSWLAANKYIVGVLLVVATAVAAVFLLR
jgi:GAF domain-containing protein